MKLRQFGLLTDENIDSDVVQWLRQAGFNVLDVCEQKLHGSSDIDLLKLAIAENRLIVTHDSDFGTLSILQGESLVGIIYLRPGHNDSQFTMEMLQVVLSLDPDVTAPFVLVARRSKNGVTVRVRPIVR